MNIDHMLQLSHYVSTLCCKSRASVGLLIDSTKVCFAFSMLSGAIREDSIPLPVVILSLCLFWRTGNELNYPTCVALSLLQFFQVKRISVDSNIDMRKAGFQ